MPDPSLLFIRMRIALPAALCTAWLLAACDSPTPPPEPPPTPASLALTAGDAQAGIVGAALPESLFVRVVDAQGRGVAGVEVQFTPTVGSASPAGTSTNANGVASTRWTLGETTGTVELAVQVPALAGQGAHFMATASRVRPTVATGLAQTCGINGHGQAFCWGANGSGELGNGGGSGSLVPVPVATELRFWTISGGAQSTCALAVDRRAYCWGQNTNGQIGDSTAANRVVPTAVKGGLRFRTLSVGAFHACGIATTGDTWCWGDGRYGRLGDGDTLSFVGSPKRVATTVAFDSVTAGGSHTCGLTADGTAWCWGYNVQGQVGNGTLANVTTPVPVLGGLHFATLRAGLSLTCGTERGTGKGYCWGNDDWTALGSAVPSEDCTIVTDYGTFHHECSTRPVPVDGPAYTVITPAELHACGLGALQVYCWGLNQFGVLGTGNTLPSGAPLGIGGYAFVDLDSYYLHTCGITIFSAVSCWGKNDYGRLGDGTLVDRWVPTPISGIRLE